MSSSWNVLFHDDFIAEFDHFDAEVQDEILVLASLLKEFGPSLRRPHADTLAGSRHKNMKELRFSASGGEWRVAFAFDPERSAILLVGGDKSGVAQGRFYRGLIARADQRFDEHLGLLHRSAKDRKTGYGKKS